MTLNYLIFASPEHVYISVNGRLISTHNRAKMFEDFKQTYSEEGVAKFFNTYGILPVMFHAAMDGDGRRKSLPATLIEIQFLCRPHSDYIGNVCSEIDCPLKDVCLGEKQFFLNVENLTVTGSFS